jgi:hypothetical protein
MLMQLDATSIDYRYVPGPRVAVRELVPFLTYVLRHCPDCRNGRRIVEAQSHRAELN